MTCRSCGEESPAEAVFCLKCGERLAAPDADEAASGSAAERVRDAVRSARAADDDEAPVWQGGYSGKAMIGSWVVAVIVTLLAGAGCFAYLPPGRAVLWLLILIAVLWGGLGLSLGYRKLNVWYELTTQRFIHKAGVLRRVTDRMEVIDIDDVSFNQGLVQRMLGVGSIRIVSSDRSHPDLQLHGIADVRRVAELIDDVRRKERRRRGLHIESI